MVILISAKVMAILIVRTMFDLTLPQLAFRVCYQSGTVTWARSVKLDHDRGGSTVG
jgi:hypothetical protein